jgi:hypothetical protein
VEDAGFVPADSGVQMPTDSGVQIPEDSGVTQLDATVIDSGVSQNPDSGVMPDAGPMPTLPDPFKVSGNMIKCSRDYIGGGLPDGQIRGTLPGVGWSSGPAINDMDNDGYLEYAPSAADQASLITIVDYDIQCVSNAGAWMQFGQAGLLCQMSDAALAYIWCSWPSPGDPGGCGGKVGWNGTSFIPAGNSVGRLPHCY